MFINEFSNLNYMNRIDSKRILESLPFYFYVIDCESFLIIDSNDHDVKEEGLKCYQHIFGFDKPCDLIDNKATCTCKLIQKSKKKINFVQNIKTSKGTFTQRVTGAPVLNDKNEVTHIISQYIDISKELKLESKLSEQNTVLQAQNKEFESLYEELKEANCDLEKAKDDVVGLKEFFENINESVQDGIWVTDKQDVIFYTNPAMEKIAGISRIEIINKNVLKDFPKETIQELTPYFEKAKSTLKPIWYEVKVITPSEKNTYQNGWLNPLIKRGEYNGMIGTIRDVTEHVSARNLIRDSKEKLNIFINESIDAQALMDSKGNILLWNKAHEILTGYSFNEVKNKKLWDVQYELLPDEDRETYSKERVRKLLKQLIKSDTKKIENSKIEFRIKRKDGSIRIIEQNVFQVETQTEKLLGSINRDITETKRAEQALKQSEEKYRSVLENVQLIGLMLDSEGKVAFANDYMLELTGWNREQIIGKDWFINFLPENSHKDVKDFFLQTMENKKMPVSHTNEIITKLGEIRLIKWNNTLHFDDRGKIISVTSIGEDITEQKRAERHLLKNKQALQKIINITGNRSKQEYFSSMVVALNEVFSANYIYIGKLIDSKKIETISLCHNGEIVENIIYDLKNTPCENLVRKETCIYTNNVSQKFPKDLLLKKLGINGYVGIPLLNNNGEAIGVLVAFFHEKIRDKQFIKSICEVFAGNIGTELERTYAENALQESEKKFKILSESSPMSVMMFQEDKWVYINPMAEKVTGYSKNELANMNFWDFIHPDYANIVKERGRVRQSGDNAPYNYDFKIITKNGVEKWVSLYGASTTFSGKSAAILSVLDITELKTVELALRDSEQKLRNITENSTNLFYQHTVNHKISFLSPQVKDILGYTVDEALIKWTEFLTDNPINLEAIKITEKAIKTGETQLPFEMELKHKSGRNVWVEVREAPLIEKGKTIGIVGALTDITKRKKANDALKESEKRYRKLFESANVGIGISTYQGHILDANQSLTKIFNYSFKEFLNINIKDLYKELADRKKILHAIEKDGEIRNFQIQMKPKGNTNLWVHISAQKFSDDDRILFVISDITKEKEAEIEIREQESKFKKYIESSPMAIFIVNEKGKYEYANKAVTKLLGYSNQEMLTMLIPDIKIVQNEKDIFDDFNKLKEKGEVKGTEIIYKAKDGSTINAIIDAVKLSENQFIAFCTDVSQLKETEIKLKERNLEYLSLNEEMEEYIGKLQNLNKELQEAKLRAEESDRLKSAFLANMSHELRTPLNGILGFSTLMRKASLPKESMLRYSEIIETSGRRLLNVVNDLFDISLIHSDQLKIEQDMFKVNELLDDINTFYNTINTEKIQSIKLKLIKGSNIEINLINDKYRLHQILKNLLDNAFKFTKEGQIEFGYNLQDENKITFFVKDTGIGISKEYLKMIFTSFKQVDDSITRDYEGAGLGLAICAGLLERMGGRIWVKSEKNIGSEFYFELDLNNKKEKRLNEQNFQNIKKTFLKDKIILIVEDDLVSYEFLKIYLENIGGSGIIQTAKGEDAVKIIESGKVDLIFMDIRLPGIDGYETTRRIRKMDKKVKIIAQTAYALENDNKKSIAAGCNDHISKPIEEKVLIGIIQKYFG